MGDMDPDQLEWPERGEADDLMRLVFKHYHLHHAVVLKKLGHAKDATSIGLETAAEKESEKLEAYEGTWSDIIKMFAKCGIAEEEMFEIEKILGTLPANIRSHFERLITMDQMLQRMMKTMEKMDYETAIQKIDTIQNRTNPMSGLDRETYEEEAKNGEDVQVFSFLPEVMAKKR